MEKNKKVYTLDSCRGLAKRGEVSRGGLKCVEWGREVEGESKRKKRRVLRFYMLIFMH